MPHAPIDLQTALDSFEEAMKHCDNIISVHREVGGGGSGRRYKEASLNRAVIVLAVAAWQAAVQDLTTAVLDTAAPVGGLAIDRQRYEISVGFTRKGIRDFATPNGEKTRGLMQGAGFDPYPAWTYRIPGGRGGYVVWTPPMVQGRLNEWLRIRHALAHGHAQLPLVDALESVRVDHDDPATLRLVDAEQCVAFMRRLVKVTAQSLATELGVTVTI